MSTSSPPPLLPSSSSSSSPPSLSSLPFSPSTSSSPSPSTFSSSRRDSHPLLSNHRLSTLSLATLMDESTQGEADDHQYNSYDEDLNTNPFFKALGKNKPVYAAATENLWTICVPCAPSLADIKAFSVDVIKSHLLSTVAGAEVRREGERRTEEEKLE